MLTKSKEQRVEVLIDVQNLYYSARNLHQQKVNFQEVLRQAISGRKFIRAFGYVVRTKTGEEKPFFAALSKFGIEIFTGVFMLILYKTSVKSAIIFLEIVFWHGPFGPSRIFFFL